MFKHRICLSSILALSFIFMAASNCSANTNEEILNAINSCDAAAAEKLITYAYAENTQWLHFVLTKTECGFTKQDNGYKIVKDLLDKGADKDYVDENNMAALNYAIRTFYTNSYDELEGGKGQNNYDTVVLLLQYGADYSVILSRTELFLMEEKVFNMINDLVCVHQSNTKNSCPGVLSVSKEMKPGYYNVSLDNGSRLNDKYSYILRDVRYASKGKSKLKTARYQYYK